MSRMESSKPARRVRRRFTDEFKAGAIQLVLDEGKTVGAVARDLDLTASSVAEWVKRAQADRTKGRTCWRSPKTDHLCSMRIDQGRTDGRARRQ